MAKQIFALAETQSQRNH
uniref:Uncharacterized protein n=1 Tax=Rhizophora mucronata TaxID=61149 RepID=A0A2P2NCI4_RHIMU